MKIWILNHVALKPSESGITRHYDLAHEMVQKGNKVTIFASSFLAYFFRWRNPDKKNYSENVNGVNFEWMWTMPYKGNGVMRILNMISFFFMSLVRGIRMKEKPDVIVGSSVHLFSCLAAYYLSRIKKSTYIVEIRDLWPRTLVDLGSISEWHPVVLMFGIIEKFVYKKAERIIITLPGAVNYMVELGIDRKKIYFIPNGINLERVKLSEVKSSLEEEVLDIRKKHKTVAMYAGSHGMANALDTIVESAAYFSPDEIAFVLIGDGPKKTSLQEKAARSDNVYFFDGVPKDEVISTLRLADILMVSMLNSPLYKYGISLNKLNDYLLAGRPILFAGDVYNDIVGEADAGVTVQPENPEAFAEGLRRLTKLDNEQRNEVKIRGFQYVSENHDIQKLADRFLRICSGQEKLGQSQ